MMHLVAGVLLTTAAIVQGSTVAERQQAVEGILGVPGVHAQTIWQVLQAERARYAGHARHKASHLHHISLANLSLPVPREIRDLVAKADGYTKVTPAEADHATESMNKMLLEQHQLLDHKVIDCRERRRSIGEAIQDAADEVRNLASETSAARGIIVEATSRIPQDRRSFEEFKVDAQISHGRCQGASLSHKVRAKNLERDATIVLAVQQALTRECGPSGAASFVQTPRHDIVGDAEMALREVNIPGVLMQSPGAEGQMIFTKVSQPPDSEDQMTFTKVSQPPDSEGQMIFTKVSQPDAESQSDDVDEIIAGATSTLRGDSPIHVKRKKITDCPAMASALGVVARKRGGPAVVGLLETLQPLQCKLNQHTCAAMLDISAEVSGEIADSQARLRANSARDRQACKDEDTFVKNQLSMETSQASDRSKELSEATVKAGEVGETVDQKDSMRQKLQAELKTATEHCAADISDILYGRMCALQKVRDGMQVLAGRTEIPEDCQVTDWDEGICSATCGSGFKSLTRKVSLAAKGGAACPPLTLNLACGEMACPNDCQVSRWSGWSACSARCEGGVQERNRVVSSKPLGDGVACPHLVDMRVCNTEACSSDCVLMQWSPWTACSRACDGGTQTRSRALRVEGKTSCPSTQSKERMALRECNVEKCDSDTMKALGDDITCAGAPLDVVLLLDASGSVTEAGFDTLKTLSLELVRRYSPSTSGTKLSVATFAKQAMSISSLTNNATELTTRLSSSLHWLKGPGNAGAGLSRAASLLAAGGRKTATPLVVMITDGRIVDPFLARQSADRLKKSGVRLAFALVGTDYKSMGLLTSMASLPVKDNVIQLPGFKEMPAFLKWTAKRIMTSTCSEVS